MKRGWYKGAEYSYFLTNTLVGWKPVFVSDPYAKIILDAFRFFRTEKLVNLLAFVIMPTHLHYIVNLTNSKLTLSDFQRDFKKWISRQVEQMLLNEERDGQNLLDEVFLHSGLIRQESPSSLINFFRSEGRAVGQGFKLWRVDEKPEAISSRDFLRQKIEYLHSNPLKAGFVQRASDYPYSSARNYELDDQSLIEIYTDLIVS